MKRLPDWQQRLYEFLESRRQAAFSWGSNDCCLFCADAVLAMTEEDPAAKFRGTYDTEAGARDVIAAAGGMEGLVTQILGEPLGPLCGRTGDIAMVRVRSGEEVVGVIDGTRVVCVGDTQTIKFPLATALKCWRVG